MCFLRIKAIVTSLSCFTAPCSLAHQLHGQQPDNVPGAADEEADHVRQGGHFVLVPRDGLQHGQSEAAQGGQDEEEDNDGTPCPGHLARRQREQAEQHLREAVEDFALERLRLGAVGCAAVEVAMDGPQEEQEQGVLKVHGVPEELPKCLLFRVLLYQDDDLVSTFVGIDGFLWTIIYFKFPLG